LNALLLREPESWCEVLGVNIGSDYVSIAKLWLCNKSFDIANMVTAALCWSLWKFRNSICFQEMHNLNQHVKVEDDSYVKVLASSCAAAPHRWL
jgi:hypothetical protein